MVDTKVSTIFLYNFIDAPKFFTQNLFVLSIQIGKCGLDVGVCYNKPKSDNSRTHVCPPEKEKSIMEAFRHFGLI